MKRVATFREIKQRLERVERIVTAMNGETPAENLAHARWIRDHEVPPPNLATLQDLVGTPKKEG